MLNANDKASILERMDKALTLLEEVCDTAVIVCTYHEGEGDTTYKISSTMGNMYAVEGSVKEWLDEAIFREDED